MLYSPRSKKTFLTETKSQTMANTTYMNTSAPSIAPTASVFPDDWFYASTAEFESQLQLSIPFWFILVVIYCILRRLYPNTWELRRKLSQNLLSHDINEEDEEDQDIDKIKFNLQNTTKPITFPTISNGYFKWIYDVWMMDSNTFYQHAGFDALVFRLYLKGCFYICAASLPYALLVLIPVYGTSNVKTKQPTLYTLSLC